MGSAVPAAKAPSLQYEHSPSCPGLPMSRSSASSPLSTANRLDLASRGTAVEITKLASRGQNPKRKFCRATMTLKSVKFANLS
eukprot:3204072-Rhodomonas_salina.1